MKIKKSEIRFTGDTSRISQARDLEEAGEAMYGAGRSLGKGIAALGQVAQVLKDTSDKKKALQRDTELGALLVNQERGYLRFKQEYDKEQHDPNTYASDMESGFLQVRDEIARDIKDPVVQESFHKFSIKRQVEITRHNFIEEEDRWLRQQKAMRIQQIEDFNKMGIEADTPEQATEFKRGIQAVIRSSSGNILKEDEAKNIEIRALDQFDKDRQRILISRAEQDIADDPDTAYAMLQSGAGYAEITDEPTRQKLTRVAKEAGRTKAERARQDQERQEREELGTQRMEALELLARGKLTYEEIKKRTTLNKHEGYTWLERARERAERKPVINTNFRAYSKILDSIGTKSKEEVMNDIANASNVTISENDAEKLLGYAFAQEHTEESSWIKKGQDLIKSQLFSSIAPELVKPEEWEAYVHASAALMEEIEASKRLKRPLKGRDILITAAEFAQGFKETDKEKRRKARERRKGHTLSPKVATDMDRDAGMTEDIPKVSLP